MPLLEGSVVALVVSKIIEDVTDQAVAEGEAAVTGHVRSWLGRDRQTLAIKIALVRTEVRFAQEYRDWHRLWFDATFLGGPAAPLLARALTRTVTVTGADLAQTWADQLGGQTGEQYKEKVEPVADQLLAWWVEELSRFEVFQARLDSRALERIAASTEQVNTGLDELRQELGRAVCELDRALVKARYPALTDFLDWPSRDRVRQGRWLAGREWVFDELEDFASGHRCGYFHIVAEAGLGKTALAAAIASRCAAPAFLFAASDGRTRPRQCLEHLCVELIDHYELAYDWLPERAGEDSGFLSRLMTEVSARGESVWLVIDALDEADATAGGRNPLGLPAELSEGVFVVLTHRPGDYTLNVAPGISQHELYLSADDLRHARDITSYLHERSTQAGVADALARSTPPVGIRARRKTTLQDFAAVR